MTELILRLESGWRSAMAEVCAAHPDPSHDIGHVDRVVAWAKRLAKDEGARLEVVVPAAYLHDFEFVSKTDSRRSQASRLSAMKAASWLERQGYPQELLPEVAHAIEAHSFSARIEPRTLEAKIVQDSDRLDAIGAVGIARCFALSGLAGRPIYNADDPFCERRAPDDHANTLDHFFVKLLKIADELQTASARAEGKRRTEALRVYLKQLRLDLNAD